MTRPKYIASCSGGKDSVATLLLAAQHNEPLDEAVFSEVMFDKDTSGEVPEHRDFIYDRLKPFCEKELGIKFTILHADKTYDDVFHHVITRGPHKGEVRGFRHLFECPENEQRASVDALFGCRQRLFFCILSVNPSDIHALIHSVTVSVSVLLCL